MKNCDAQGSGIRRESPPRLALPFVRILACLVAVLLVGCGAESNGKGEESVDLNACELLPPSEVGRLMGEPVTKSDNTLQMSGVSQCVHTLSEPRERLTLLIRYSNGGITPLSRAEQAAQERLQDDSGGGEFLAAAIEAGQDLDGIGERAFAFDLAGLNLWVFWDQDYFMTLTVSGRDDPATALAIAKEAAKIAIDRLNI